MPKRKVKKTEMEPGLLRKHRNDIEMPQQTVAHNLGKDSSTISSWENFVRCPNSIDLCDIQELFGLSDTQAMDIAREFKART
jgi:DNA-binding XRE family transcriptional regulator